MRFFKFIFISLFFIIFSDSFGQEILLSDTLLYEKKILLRKEKSGFLMVHTQGFGIGYRSGKHKTGYKKRMFEVELTGMMHSKEVKVINPYFENAKSYVYGKENSFLLIRAGMGIQKIINSKPYWGGVELKYFYYGGISLGLLKPVYLYILNETNIDYEYNLTTEKYDPNKHFTDNIYGRASFFKGLGKIKPLPGLYLKAGLNFDYGANDRSIKAIEAGATFDIYPKPVPIMAFNQNSYYFLSLYVSFSLGVRGY